MNERLSALMDDALDEGAVDSLMDAMRRDPQAERTWQLYGLIGDSLRGEVPTEGYLARRVMMDLDREPTVLAPQPKRPESGLRMRWLLPIAASVMGVGAVAWVSQSINGSIAPQPVAQVVHSHPVSVPVAPNSGAANPANEQGQVAPDGAVAPVQAGFDREYLIAHQGYSPGASMSGVAQYVRTVSESRGELPR
ncbi:MAG TPA: sigma-E factor negative regulatory protein [Rhodocyclaceae bacterium]|nr:sigma-E factor negative regulatory protein [Rhodocyclaceae bacterium]HNB79035.1 sigma-E factor negative regulatory protein [Rhodocyclaceae bacterium]